MAVRAKPDGRPMNNEPPVLDQCRRHQLGLWKLQKSHSRLGTSLAGDGWGGILELSRLPTGVRGERERQGLVASMQQTGTIATYSTLPIASRNGMVSDRA